MTDYAVLLFGAVAFSTLTLWFNVKSTYLAANLISYCLTWLGISVAGYALTRMVMEVLW